MNILLLGPQGSGKGTQGRLLAKKYNFFYFESGEFLRELAESNLHIKEVLNTGELLSDNEMFEIVKNYLNEKNIFENVLFDGYPRSLNQYQMLVSWLKAKDKNIDIAFLLNISDTETLRRLSGRVMDSQTGIVYNTVTNPPSADIDQSRFVHREDDTPEAIKERLALYHEVTQPLVDELRKENKLIEINGERPIDEIQSELAKFIEEYKWQTKLI